MDKVRFVVLIAGLIGEVAIGQNPHLDRDIPPSTGSGIAREFPMTVIRNQCLEFAEVKPSDLRDCRVSEFGEFGSADGQTYYYALYCLIPSDAPDGGKCDDDSFNARNYRERGLTIFAYDARSRNPRLVFERVASEIGTVYYQQPQIIRSAAGTLLYLPIALDGTGHINESEYFLRDGGAWHAVEAQGWLAELQRRIPAGLEIWKGVWPNVQTMKAEAVLYRSGDANCCPTGGIARIGLAIRSRRLVIDSLVIDRAH